MIGKESIRQGRGSSTRIFATLPIAPRHALNILFRLIFTGEQLPLFIEAFLYIAK